MLYREKLEEMRQSFPGTWDYYRIHRDSLLTKYFHDPVGFIQKTFQHAEKAYLAPKLDRHSTFSQAKISDARAAHSVSTLLLGAMLANQFCNGDFLKFQTESTRCNHNTEPYTFSYLWTMISLYHDVGYYLERDKDLAQIHLEQYARKDMDSCLKKQKHAVLHLLKTLGIQKTIWSKDAIGCRKRYDEHNDWIPEHLSDRLICAYNQRPKCIYASNQLQPIVFPCRSREDIDGYALFRLIPSQERESCVDHGIFGGYLLFDSFIKNYIAVYHEEKRHNDSIDLSHFSHNGKKFDFDQLTVFAYVADCIMNHNIWRQEITTEDGQLCKDLGLYHIIGANYKRVCLMKNPMLFILALADSLEPYKLFCETGIDSHSYDTCELWNIFDHTEFAVCGNMITIKVPKGKEERFCKQLKSMKMWLAIDTNCDNGTFTISPSMER